MAGKFPLHPKYIPIIKWQKYEQIALRKLHADVKDLVLPCIEIRDSKQHQSLLKDYQSTWSGLALIDYANPKGSLTATRTREFLDFLGAAHSSGLPVSPVLNPSDPNAGAAALLAQVAKFGEATLRLRISAPSITDVHLNHLRAAVTALAGQGVKARLLIDLGVTPQTWSAIDVANFSAEVASVKSLGFSAVHLASGAYPESLQSVKTGVGFFDRRDWRFWSDLNQVAPQLLIGYGDYGVLSPVWTEEALERRGARVAIRYTRPDSWLILRADGKTKPDSVAISQILVSAYAGDFKGAPYSYGDELLATRADPAIPLPKKLCGHYHITEGWSHHVAMVIKDQY